MPARIAHLSLLVPDYDAALDFFCRIGFECREETELGDGKRWCGLRPRWRYRDPACPGRRRPPGRIHRRAGRRAGLAFPETDDLARDYQRLQAAGVTFETLPRDEPYGRVVVWRDPWGIVGT
ncbi:VOC family protein [Paracoccus marcusii]|uniref:VOC family protein n=1 Tax=Paracoccus marcusii TaxID=59779 RepID=UPI0039C89DF9